MTHIRIPAFALASLALVPFLLGAGPMPARMHRTPVDTSMERYVQDLEGSDPHDRLYAARALRSELRLALKRLRRAEPGSLAWDDAATVVDDYTAAVAPACIRVLGLEGVSSPCADMLGWLEVPEALPALEKACEAPPSRRFARKAQKAMSLIRASSPDAP